MGSSKLCLLIGFFSSSLISMWTGFLMFSAMNVCYVSAGLGESFEVPGVPTLNFH